MSDFTERQKQTLEEIKAKLLASKEINENIDDIEKLDLSNLSNDEIKNLKPTKKVDSTFLADNPLISNIDLPKLDPIGNPENSGPKSK